MRGVIAFRIGAGGLLTPIDRTTSEGSAPCFVSVTDDGRHLLVANYASGSVAAIELDADGRFAGLAARHQHSGAGPHPRQEGPHAHCIRPGASGLAARSAYAVDLGTDRVIRYSLDDGLAPVDEFALPPGAGPRHIVFHPSHPVAFIVCELDNTLVTADVDPGTGALRTRSITPTLPDDFDGDAVAAEVRIHPDGRHLYVSNRGHDSIAVFAFDDSHEAPRPITHVACGGATPRNFAIHPSGRTLLVANQDSNALVSFAIDPDSGVPVEREERHDLTAPVCLTYVEVRP